jgi:hypothetical protein
MLYRYQVAGLSSPHFPVNADVGVKRSAVVSTSVTACSSPAEKKTVLRMTTAVRCSISNLSQPSVPDGCAIFHMERDFETHNQYTWAHENPNSFQETQF